MPDDILGELFSPTVFNGLKDALEMLEIERRNLSGKLESCPNLTCQGLEKQYIGDWHWDSSSRFISNWNSRLLEAIVWICLLVHMIAGGHLTWIFECV